MLEAWLGRRERRLPIEERLDLTGYALFDRFGSQVSRFESQPRGEAGVASGDGSGHVAYQLPHNLRRHADLLSHGDEGVAHEIIGGSNVPAARLASRVSCMAAFNLATRYFRYLFVQLFEPSKPQAKT